jgi:hypothetical protein
METLIGFVIGYLLGTRHGRDGVRKIRESIEAIAASQEARQAFATGVGVAGSAARHALGGGAGKVLTGAAEALARKADKALRGPDGRRTERDTAA